MSRLQPVWGWPSCCKSLEALERLLGVSRVPGAGGRLGVGVSTGVGESREGGQGGQASEVIPAHGCGFSGMGSGTLMCGAWGSASSPGSPGRAWEGVYSAPVWASGMNSPMGRAGVSVVLVLPLHPPCNPSLLLIAAQTGTDHDLKASSMPSQSSTLSSSRIWPLELPSTPKTPRSQV